MRRKSPFRIALHDTVVTLVGIAASTNIAFFVFVGIRTVFSVV